MESTLHLVLGRGAELLITPGARLKAVQMDLEQIKQVIMNLVVNAAEAMPEGGKLTLATANVALDQESIRRSPELKPGAFVMLAVADTGAGMSKEVKARIFEPFFTTKSVGHGMGLGLSTCDGIIKQSGGFLSVSSETARGSTFTVYLPQVEPQAGIPVQRLDSTGLPGGTETILLVEDAPALRELSVVLLERLGYTVLAAANGAEALSLCRQGHCGRIDLLFTVAAMPRLNGVELAAGIRLFHPRARILFTAGRAENDVVQQGLLHQGAVFLIKPYAPSELAHKVRELLAQPAAPGAASGPAAILLKA
jgi:two-component system cell cycle sensor histidine kinase/response regulator CckA